MVIQRIRSFTITHCNTQKTVIYKRFSYIFHRFTFLIKLLLSGQIGLKTVEKYLTNAGVSSKESWCFFLVSSTLETHIFKTLFILKNRSFCRQKKTNTPTFSGQEKSLTDPLFCLLFFSLCLSNKPCRQDVEDISNNKDSIYSYGFYISKKTKPLLFVYIGYIGLRCVDWVPDTFRLRKSILLGYVRALRSI